MDLFRLQKVSIYRDDEGPADTFFVTRSFDLRSILEVRRPSFAGKVIDLF